VSHELESAGVRPSPGAATFERQIAPENPDAPDRMGVAAPGDGRTPALLQMNWDQLRAILWLRFRLTRNQFARAGTLNAILSIFLAAMLAFAAIGFAVGGFILGIVVGVKTPPWTLVFIWDGIIMLFLIFWMSGLLIELQRSESIDMARMLHLPITLNQVFLFNYVASHFTPSIVLFVPAMLAMGLGLSVAAGPQMTLLLPLVAAFIVMITAWTYCLRGWLAALMMNKRRRRAIIVWMTLILVLIGQLPNLIFNLGHFQRHGRSHKALNPAEQSIPAELEGIVEAHLVLPPGWVGYATMGLKQHQVWPAVAATAAAALLASFGLMRAYRLSIRFYMGADEVELPRETAEVKPDVTRTLLVERRLPLLPDDTAALALATFRSLLRAPELKMVAVMPVVLAFVMFMAHRNMPTGKFPPAASGFAVTAAVALAVFAFAQTMANTFGLDRSGFRTLVLLPTPRHQILLAKNLAFFPFMALVAAGLLALAQWLTHASTFALLTSLLQLPTAFLLFSLITNLMSILVPYRMSQTLKAKKPKAIVIVAVFLSMLVAPVVMVPVFIPPAVQLLASKLGLAPWLPVNLLAAIVILAIAATLYRVLLPPLGRLLQRREPAILREVTEETE
jgi:hypothetical protein